VVQQVGCSLSDSRLTRKDTRAHRLRAELVRVAAWVVRRILLFVDRFKDSDGMSVLVTHHVGSGGPLISKFSDHPTLKALLNLREGR